MSLQLNEPTEHYKEFYGRNIDKMPELIAERRTPLSVSGLMKRRLEALTASEKVRNSWLYNYFDTGDGIAYHPDGKVKLVLDAQPLRELNPNSKLKNRALILEDGLYESLPGKEFSKSDLEKYTGKWLAEQQINNNPFWQYLARSPELLEEYSHEVKNLTNNDTNMGVFVASPQKVPTMRLWFVYRADDDYRSYALGRLDLGYVNGRLVGVSAGGAGARENLPQGGPYRSPAIVRSSLDEMLSIVDNPDLSQNDKIKKIKASYGK